MYKTTNIIFSDQQIGHSTTQNFGNYTHYLHCIEMDVNARFSKTNPRDNKSPKNRIGRFLE